MNIAESLLEHQRNHKSFEDLVLEYLPYVDTEYQTSLDGTMVYESIWIFHDSSSLKLSDEFFTYSDK